MNGVSTTSGLLPANWPEHIERLAGEWRLPAEWLAAACLASGVPCEAPAGEPPEHVLELVDELLDWQSYYLADALARVDRPAGSAAPDGRLREFYRAIYCDAPQMHHVLMLLAAHHMRLFSPDAGPALASDTLAVYVPVAAMLGMYHVRRCWIEESLRLTRGEEYQKQAAEMGIRLDEPTSEAIERAVDRQQAACSPAASGSALPPNRDLLNLEERALLFSRLRHDLDGALRHEFGPENSPDVQLIFDLPGHALQRRERANGTMDNPQLIVRVLCHSRGDCYRAMDVIHRVTRLAGAEHTQVIRDYIASPQPNGYRALQTLCIYPPPSEFSADGRLIKFHILTGQMQRFNEWGILAGLAEEPARRARTAAWWNRLDEQSRSLSSRTKDKYADIIAYLHHFPPGSAADPLYCFTPQGDIILMKPGHTALDFAYRVHSQLGPQTAQVFINGESVPLETKLQNGDLVNVIYDPFIARIDFSWQDKVGSKRTRGKIRAALQRRAGYTHAGRREFEKALIRQIDLYKRRPSASNPYTPPACTTDEIDQFLERAAARHKLAGRDALYAALANSDKLAAELAHLLITENNIPNLQRANGEPLPSGVERIERCPACRPTAKDAIEGRLLGAAGDTLIIHIPGCAFSPPNAPILPLQWDPDNSADTWPLYHFEVNTGDFDGLLNKVLRLVYAIPDAYLFSIEARVNELWRAIIKLDVAVKLPQLCRDLQSQIIALASDTQVSYRALSLNRRGDVPPMDMSRQIDNPFTESQVTDWRFMGRDEVINSILTWLNGHTVRSQVMLLHGQRRVGKSSLVSRLCEQGNLKEGDQPVLPVLVDFRMASLERPETVAELLVQNLYNTIGAPSPRLELHDDPVVWLDRQLGEAAHRQAGRRLLFLIDEFDAGYNHFLARGRRPPMMAHLRAIMDAHRAIRWLLVVQDIFLADPLLQAALPHMPLEVPQVDVCHLSPESARQLIVDLTVSNGYEFGSPAPGEDEIPDQIVKWTAGNPYFIHVICRRLLMRVARERSRQILPHDLNLTIQWMLGRSIYFDHFTQHLESHPTRHRFVYHLTHALERGQRRPLVELASEMAALLGQPTQKVAAQFDFLEQLGILETTRDASRREVVGIPVHILHQWLVNYWSAEPGDLTHNAS